MKTRQRWVSGCMGLGLMVCFGGCAGKAVVAGGDSIHEAARNGDRAAVQVLVEAGADVDATDVEGVSVLHYAALSGNAAVVEFLLDLHADPKVLTRTGETVLHWAAATGNLGVMRLMTRQGIDVNALNMDGETALDLANSREGEYPDLVKALTNAGAKRAEDLAKEAEAP